jgi:hypothetical protein
MSEIWKKIDLRIEMCYFASDKTLDLRMKYFPSAKGLTPFGTAAGEVQHNLGKRKDGE